MTSLYHEIHVTTEFDASRLDEAKELAKIDGFHMGDLLLMKTDDERSHKDMFFTARSSYGGGHAESLTSTFCHRLRRAGFKILRWKIEDTVADSKVKDTLGLLG